MATKNSTRIYERDGATKVRLDAVHNADGSLTISGYDLGDAPRQAYGREDLEYELTIPAQALRGAVTALLRALLAPTEMPITTLRVTLDQDRIPHTFRIVP